VPRGLPSGATPVEPLATLLMSARISIKLQQLPQGESPVAEIVLIETIANQEAIQITEASEITEEIAGVEGQELPVKKRMDSKIATIGAEGINMVTPRPPHGARAKQSLGVNLAAKLEVRFIIIYIYKKG
jgi:hypothetical protein